MILPGARPNGGGISISEICSDLYEFFRIKVFFETNLMVACISMSDLILSRARPNRGDALISEIWSHLHENFRIMVFFLDEYHGAIYIDVRPHSFES